MPNTGKIPSSVYEGMRVFAPINNKWLLCEVRAAMGITARVYNELHSIDTWFRIDELRRVVPIQARIGK